MFRSYPPGAGRGKSNGPPTPHNGKKTKGRVSKLLLFNNPAKNVFCRQMTIIHCYKVKIKMEFIDNKLRRYTTFSKRKTGIMKKVSDNVILLTKRMTSAVFFFFNSQQNETGDKDICL